MRLTSMPLSTPNGATWRAALSLLTGSLCTLALPALQAAAAGRRAFDLPAGKAESALKRLSQQAGVQLVFDSRLVDGVTVNAVRGKFTPLEAAQHLLAGTPLRARRDDQSGILSVEPEPGPTPTKKAPARAESSPATRAASAAGSSSPNSPNPTKSQPMKSPRSFFAALAGWLTVATAADAQTLPSPVPPKTPPSEEVLVLSRFDVAAEKDDGYRASSTLAGTRLRTDLRDVAASVTVITKDFMNDIGANNLEGLLTYTAGTEVEGLGGNISGSSSSGAFTDFSGGIRRVQGQTRVRGIGSAEQTRDYFITSAPLDGYIVDRVEVNRGPNAMLFGLGSPAGVINSGLIRALPSRTKTRVETQFDQESSGRLVFDHNQVLAKDRVALRVATLLEDKRFQMKPAHIRDKRVYVTGTVRPWKDAMLRVGSETAKQTSNKPYTTTPIDQVSWWWVLGKPVYDPTTGIGRYLGTAPTDPNLQVFNATGGIQGNLIGSLGRSLHLFAEDPNSSRLGITGLNPAIQAIEGFNNRVRLTPTGAYANDGFRRLATSQNYLQQKNAATNPALRDFWRDFRLTDTSVYNFYDQMLEGPNKREWAFWDTFNTAFEQRLGQNAGFEVAYDWQKLEAGYVQPLQFRQNAINVDITTHLPTGQPNPNLGRPFHTTELGFVNSNSTEREAYRATAYYQLDLTRLKQPWLAKLLGRHIFTGSYTNQSRENYGYGGRLDTVGLDYQLAKFANPADRIIAIGQQERHIMRQSYIGPSLLNATSPRNAGIQGVTAVQNIDGKSSLTAFYYQRPNLTPVALGQFQTGTFSVLNNPRYDLSKTTIGGDHSFEETKSLVFVSNNYWWDHTLVSTMGWREDRFASQQAPATVTSTVDGLRIIDQSVWKLAPGINQKVSKFNYGLVLHTPPFIRGKLPLGADVSITYNRADNFLPGRQTYDIFDQPLSPTTGKTEEWGVLLSLFRGKLELRATKYETASQGATNGSFTETQNRLVRRLDSQMEAIRTPGYREEMTALGLASSLAAWDQFEKSSVAQSLFKTFRFKFNDTVNIVDKDDRIGEVVSTSDILAEGYEFDLTYNPTPSWRIALNAARQETVNGNTGLPVRAMVALLNPVWAGTAGNLPLGLGSGTTLAQDWGTTVNEVLKVALLDGAPRPELRKWRFNAVTNYTFRGGMLNGIRLGGAYRWQDKSAVGFPVRILANGSAIADVSKPYFGAAETNVDAWIGYSRGLWKNKIRWSVQLNVRNIGLSNRLVTVSVQPDGTPDSPRIVTPQSWQLTNSFEF